VIGIWHNVAQIMVCIFDSNIFFNTYVKLILCELVPTCDPQTNLYNMYIISWFVGASKATARFINVI